MKYLSFTEPVTELERLLNEYSKDGWRLVTCQVTSSHGAIASGTPNATVIMEKQIYTEEEDTAEETPKDEGMPMIG